MEKALLIAEKPDLMRHLKDAYDKNRSKIPYDITFVSQIGHLVTLLTPSEMDEEQKTWKWENLPFHPEEHGGWQYKIIKEEKTGFRKTPQDYYECIEKELHSGKYDFVINAGDSEQEGELLIRLVLWKAKNTLPIKRFWQNTLTEKEIVNALLHLRDDEHDPMLCNLLSAAFARQHSDYRFGMNISEAASLKMKAKVACGRVKTPILAMVYRRENEIRTYKPKTVYGIKAIYEEGFSGILSEAMKEEESEESNKDKEEKKEEKDTTIWFDTKKKAEDFIGTLSKNGTVKKYEKKEVKTYPPKLFKLSTIQVEGGKYGIKANDTLKIIQSLYEKKYLSYPRTDCEYIGSSEDFEGMLSTVSKNALFAPYISKISKADIERVRNTKKWVNDKELTEHGHSALVPTTIPCDVSTLSVNEKLIYELVCRQFVAIFLPPMIQSKTTIITEIDGYTFKSAGKTLVSKGYAEIFGTKTEDVELPVKKIGDSVTAKNYDIPDKTSTKPKHFDSATLIQACENPSKYLNDPTLASKKLTIGTPATRAPIIDNLIYVDKYLEYKKEGKKEYLVPTKIGELIIKNLDDCKICKVDMTGEWEKKLNEVRAGRLSLPDLEVEMKKEVEAMIEDIKWKKMDVIGKPKYPEVGVCPKCGKPIISGPKGFFCSGYKEGCKVGAYKEICGAKITDKEFEVLLKGEEITKTLRKESKSWQQRLKYNIDECKIEFVKAPEIKNGLLCPKCGKDLVENQRTVKCDCGFTLWKLICGKQLTDKQVHSLILDGKCDEIKGFTSKAGKKFNAKLKLDKETGKIEFDFGK